MHAGQRGTVFMLDTPPHLQVNSLHEQVAQAQAREAARSSPLKQQSLQEQQQEQHKADQEADALPGTPARSGVTPGADDTEQLLTDSARKQQELAGKVSALKKQCTDLSTRLTESERKGDMRVGGSSTGGCRLLSPAMAGDAQLGLMVHGPWCGIAISLV
jgi:hypothetical protein